MICAYCKSDIDNDSFYCDQCNKEVFICPECGKPGKGKNCVEDGNPLFSPLQKSLSGQNGMQPPAGSPQNVSIFNQQVVKPQAVRKHTTQKPLPPDSTMIPGLKLINSHLKIDIDVKDGAIIGRSAGDYLSIFSKFSQISGKHVQFIFDKNNGWTILDLGSTNGVSISNGANWKQAIKLSPDMPVAIKDNTFLLIANIEFQIKIIPPQSPDPGTNRL